MQAILLSIQPYWCEKIAAGEKLLEIRKFRPKIEAPFTCYIYQTKKTKGVRGFTLLGRHRLGKVIGEFTCDYVDEFQVFENGLVQCWHGSNLKDSCLTYEEVSSYIGKNRKGYAWNISDLKIYDEPKELREFKRWIKRQKGALYHEDMLYLTRPPQSCCYVEALQTSRGGE